jgi:hypothetical protein
MSEALHGFLLPLDRAGIAAFAASLDRATVQFTRTATDCCASAIIAVSGRAVRFDRAGARLRLCAMRGGVLGTANGAGDLVPLAKAYLVPISQTVSAEPSNC